MNFIFFLQPFLCCSIILSISNVKAKEIDTVKELLHNSTKSEKIDNGVSFLQTLGNLTKKEIVNNPPGRTIVINNDLIKIKHVDSSSKFLQILSTNSEKLINDEIADINHTGLPIETLPSGPDEMGVIYELGKEALEERLGNENEWSESSYLADAEFPLFDYYSVDGKIVEVILGEKSENDDLMNPNAHPTDEYYYLDDSSEAIYADPPEGYSYNTTGGYTYFSSDEEWPENVNLINTGAQLMDEVVHDNDTSVGRTHPGPYGYNNSDTLVYDEYGKYYYNISDGNYYNASGLEDASTNTLHNDHDSRIILIFPIVDAPIRSIY